MAEEIHKDQEEEPVPFVKAELRAGMSDEAIAALDKAEGISKGVIHGSGPVEYDPKVHGHPLTDENDDSEFGEPDGEGVTDVDDTMQDSDVHPYVVTMTFFGAARPTEEDQLVDVLEQVIRDAEGRGLFHFHSSMGIMKMEHVAPGSPLHQAVTGQP